MLTDERTAAALVSQLGTLVGESMNMDGTEVGQELTKHEKRILDALRWARLGGVRSTIEMLCISCQRGNKPQRHEGGAWVHEMRLPNYATMCKARSIHESFRELSKEGA